MKRVLFSPWLFIFILFCAVIWRIVVIQVFPERRVLEYSESQYRTYLNLSTSRGSITDRSGNVLALSLPVSSFFLDPVYWIPSKAASLRGILSEKVIRRISSSLPGRFHWVARKLNEDTAQRIIKKNLEGIYPLRETSRSYPNGSLLSHVLGYCDIDGKGLSGVELVWNSILFEPPQSRVVLKRPFGLYLENSATAASRRKKAGSVRLTVDSKIQYIMEKRLVEGAQVNKAKWAAAICMNVKTGEIIAMASWPNFNANDRKTLLDGRRRKNNVINRVYEPGSTFKPIVVGIALENAIIRKNDVFPCHGRIRIADKYISDVHRHDYGELSLEGILVKSSNVGMAQIGMRLNPYKFYQELHQWGVGHPTGIELNGEEAGLLLPPEQWFGVIPANISIGQGVATTPLQLLTAFSATVNGGHLLKPYIVSQVTDKLGDVVYKGDKEIVADVISEKTSSWLRSALRAVVVKGSGKRANTPIVKVGGKTGTAQVASKGKYIKDKMVASFVGFWPCDFPQYSMLVVIGEPEVKNHYGSTVAAPVFRKIIEDIYRFENFTAKDTVE